MMYKVSEFVIGSSDSGLSVTLDILNAVVSLRINGNFYDDSIKHSSVFVLLLMRILFAPMKFDL